jgi:hypothetical protein
MGVRALRKTFSDGYAQTVAAPDRKVHRMFMPLNDNGGFAAWENAGAF